MVRRLIQEENIGRLDEARDNGEPLPPSAGERGSRSLEVRESSASESFGHDGLALRIRDGGALHGLFDNRKHGFARIELGNLSYESGTGPLPHGHVARVGAYSAFENL